MSHRKVIELTIRLNVDVDNDDLVANMADQQYLDEIDDRIEGFFLESKASVMGSSDVSVQSVEVTDYKIVH